jgi:heme/copper-type cytochrome/quinol oxidase subunit 2
MAPRVLARRSLVPLLVLVAGLALSSDAGLARRQEPIRREYVIKAHRYEFSESRIEVARDDVVKITLVAEDIPHSFTVDAYRIAKRAAPGSPVTFEFRADRPGTFPFYCNLTIDDGCRGMHGELVVIARQH